MDCGASGGVTVPVEKLSVQGEPLNMQLRALDGKRPVAVESDRGVGARRNRAVPEALVTDTALPVCVTLPFQRLVMAPSEVERKRPVVNGCRAVVLITRLAPKPPDHWPVSTTATAMLVFCVGGGGRRRVAGAAWQPDR